MVWGWGPTPLGPSRAARALSGNGDAKRIEVIRQAARQGAAEGWSALFDPPSKLRYLSASFGTKLIHFAGWRRTGAPRPLILDRNVAAGLADAGIRVPGVWTGTWYLEYLRLAERWAEELGWLSEDGPRSDAIEYTLFDRGRRSARERRREAVLARLGELPGQKQPV